MAILGPSPSYIELLGCISAIVDFDVLLIDVLLMICTNKICEKKALEE